MPDARMMLYVALRKRFNVEALQGQVRDLSATIPEKYGLWQKAKLNERIQRDLLESREEELGAGVEGKNEGQRKAALVAMRRADQGYMNQLNLVNSAGGATIDHEIAYVALRHQWQAIRGELALAIASFNFLAGSQEQESAHDTEA